jgi:5-carboxymethyl-2-hydroxymuconate isomerase
MKTESMAVLRWMPSELVEQGEDAIRQHLEDALADAVGSNGYAPQGEIRVRAVEADEYPQVTAAKPEGDDGAVLYLAEVEVG